MRLVDLEPGFYRYEERVEEYDTVHGKIIGSRQYKVPVKTIEEAQCIFFICPICHNKSGHQIEVTFANRGVADNHGTHNKEGKPTRWGVSGSDFTNLTTTPSILLEGGCAWHGFITNGEVT
jgi:hypothetical protein